MLKMLRWLLIAAGMAVLASGYAEEMAEPDPLLFGLNFDHFNTTAQKGGGGTRELALPSPDLQLRMFKGVSGTGNAVCLSNREELNYPMRGNFHPEAGTVSLWISPQNYELSDPVFQYYFSTRTNQFTMLVYKYYEDTDCILFYLNYQGVSHHARIAIDPADWQPGKWYRLDAVWSPEGMKLYVNGKSARGKYANEVKFSEPIHLPEPLEGDRIAINAVQSDNYANLDHRTAYDDIQILDRPLSAAEVLTAYEKVRPSGFDTTEQKPTVTIPRNSASVTVDGVLTEAEWQNAARIPLIQPFYRQAQQEPVRTVAAAQLQYSETDLYLAVRMTPAPGECTVTDHDGELWNDDTFELHLRNPETREQFQWIVNPSGAIYDARNRDSAWDSGAVAAVTSDAEGWNVELRIPLAALSPTLPIGTWAANLGVQKRHGELREANIVTWARIAAGGFDAEEFFGVWNWGVSPDAARIYGLDELENGVLTFAPAVVGAAGHWSTALQSEDAKPALQQGGFPVAGIRRTLPQGRIKFAYAVTDAEQHLLAAQECYAMVRQPMQLTYEGFPEHSEVAVKVDLRNASEEFRQLLRQKGQSVKLTLKTPDGGDAASVTARMTGEVAVISLPIPFVDLAVGEYRIEAECGTFVASVPFRVPDMAPYRARVAADHTVPAPWTPVQNAGELRFSVQDRVYEFKRGPFPLQITSQGRQLLAAAPELSVTTGRGKQQIVWSQPAVSAEYPDFITLKSEGESDDFRLESTGSLWFDGMYRFQLRLTPKHRLTVTELRLTWSLFRDNAEYLLTPYFKAWTGDELKFHWRPGGEDSMVWLTGPEAGLAWWCGSEANWRNDDAPTVQLRREQDRVEVGIDVIRIPGTTALPLEYDMLFQATPAKRLQPEYRNFRFYHGHSEPQQDNVAFPIGWSSENGIIQWDNIKNWISFQPEFPEELDRNLERLAARGVTCYMYSQPFRLTKSDPEYDYFFPLWSARTEACTYKDPVSGEVRYSESCCGLTPASDRQLYHLEALFRDHPGIAGAYYDLNAPGALCTNERHGCKKVDAFGRECGNSTAMGFREFNLRSYKLHRRYGKIQINHGHNMFFPFIHDFGDYWWPGEEQVFAFGANPDYHYCEIPRAELQAAYNSKIRGVGMILLPQLFRATDYFPALKARQDELSTPEWTLKVMTPMLLHDCNVSEVQFNPAPLRRWWELRDAIHIADAVFHGYWFDPSVSTDSASVPVSYYSWEQPVPYRLVLIVANLGREDRTVNVRFDGLQPGLKESEARFCDLWDDARELPAGELKHLAVKANNFRLIGVR